MNTDSDHAENLAHDREQRRRQACQCGHDLPGRCPGAANCPYSDYASAEDDREQETILAALRECDEVLKCYKAAGHHLDRLWRTLPKAAGAFVDDDSDGLEFDAPEWGLKVLSAFLHGQLARADDTCPQTNPYERALLSTGQPYVPSHERGLHKAWAEGFKTDAEREADAAERASDAADRERCGEPV